MKTVSPVVLKFWAGLTRCRLSVLPVCFEVLGWFIQMQMAYVADLKCCTGLTRCRLSVSPVVLKCWAG